MLTAQVINRLPIRPASWLTRHRHKTVLQRMLCKGRGQTLPINALCTASFDLPLPRKLRMAAHLSLRDDQVTWLPLAHTSTLQPQCSSAALHVPPHPEQRGMQPDPAVKCQAAEATSVWGSDSRTQADAGSKQMGQEAHLLSTTVRI